MLQVCGFLGKVGSHVLHTSVNVFIQMCCYKDIISDNIQEYTERDFLEIGTPLAAA